MSSMRKMKRLEVVFSFLSDIVRVASCSAVSRSDSGKMPISGKWSRKMALAELLALRILKSTLA